MAVRAGRASEGGRLLKQGLGVAASHEDGVRPSAGPWGCDAEAAAERERGSLDPDRHAGHGNRADQDCGSVGRNTREAYLDHGSPTAFLMSGAVDDKG